MVAVTVDSKMRSQFASAHAQIEVRDEHGQFLGYFVPAGLGTPEDYRRARDQIDRDELERRKASPEPGITTAELMNRLHALGAKQCGSQ